MSSESKPVWKDPKVSGGLVAVVAGLLVIGVNVERGEANDELGCTLTSAGMASVALGLSRGRTTSEVISLTGSAIAGSACKAAVKSLAEGKATSVRLSTPDGQAIPQYLTRDLLTAPATQPPFGRFAECLGWLQSQLLFELCTDGVIEGKPAAAG